MLTVKRLKQVLIYKPKTGEWFWRAINPNSRMKIGNRAGYILQCGYWLLRVDGKRYYSSRLAWFYMTGRWPKQNIDHIDRNRANDRWKNLRECNQSQNRMNSSTQLRKHPGLRGTYFQDGKWKAIVGKDKKLVYLGRFPTTEMAHAVYLAKAKELFGEFVP